MIARFMDWAINADWTAEYAILVWGSALLTVAWHSMMHDDPANRSLNEWDMRLIRMGVTIMVAGLLLTVLFGGDQNWQPWPPMLLVPFGLDFFLFASILTLRHRIKLRGLESERRLAKG